MKLVIDIDEEDYAAILANADIVNKRKKHTLEEAVINGTPLPKGHGRLIDADELYKQDKEEWLCPQNAPFISTDYAHVFAEIDHAPTIIEAESEE